LDANVEKSKSDIENLFTQLTDELEERKHTMIHDCESKYNLYHEKLENEVAALNDYHDIISVSAKEMLKSVKSQSPTEQRINQNVKMMVEALNKEPTTIKIPVDIKFYKGQSEEVRRYINETGKIHISEIDEKATHAGKKSSEPNLPKVNMLNAKRDAKDAKKNTS